MAEPTQITPIPRPTGMPPTNGYSHAVVASGEIVAVSGQLPIDQDGNLVGEGDPLTQTRQVFHNLTLALAAGGSDVGHILRLNFFVLDLADLDAIRIARAEFLIGHPEPANSLVQVSGLVLPGARLEIDALAVVKQS